MSERQCYTPKEVLTEVFVDKNSDFDLDVADSLSYLIEQVCEAGQQDSVKISFQTLFNAENTIVTP